MTNTIAGVSALIKTKLESVQIGGQDAFASVLEEPRGDKTDYPCAEILPTGGATVKRIDTGRNERVVTFKLMLYQEQSEQGFTSAEACDRMKAVCDAVMDAFDTDKDLGLEIENSLLARMTFDFAGARTAGPFATFDLECAIIVPSV